MFANGNAEFRDRMSETSGYFLAARLPSNTQAAALFRQQAAAMRGAPGVTQAQIDAILRAAEQAERQSNAPTVPPRVERNVQTLRIARSRVSDAQWGEISGFAAGSGLSELRSAPEEEYSRRLEQLRTLHAQTLEEQPSRQP